MLLDGRTMENEQTQEPAREVCQLEWVGCYIPPQVIIDLANTGQ